jgi:hypothetical protein
MGGSLFTAGTSVMGPYAVDACVARDRMGPARATIAISSDPMGVGHKPSDAGRTVTSVKGSLS